MIRITTWCFTLLFCLLTLYSTLQAGPGDLIRSITDPHPATGPTNGFGAAVTTLGNKAIISSPYDITDGNGAGLVYAFDGTSGSLQLTFHNPAPTGRITDFGLSLSTLGGDIIVGAPNAEVSQQNTSNVGAVYRYSSTTGSLLKTYTSPIQRPPFGNAFGASVAPYNSDLLIGEPGYDPPLGPNTNPNYGAVRLVNGTTGALTSTIVRPSPIGGESLGSAIAIGNGFMVAGAHNNSAVGPNSGAAYVFDLSTGAQLQAFNSGNPRSNENFGWSVATIGNSVIVGAPNLGSFGPDYSGAAYLFDNTTGNLLHTFRNPIPGSHDWFGYSLAVVGNQILIGAPADSTTSSFGRAFLYDATNFELLHTFVNPGPSTSEAFGSSVAGFGNGNYLIAAGGAGGNDEIGAAYVFASVPEPSVWTLTTTVFACIVWFINCRVRFSSNSPTLGLTGHGG